MCRALCVEHAPATTKRDRDRERKGNIPVFAGSIICSRPQLVSHHLRGILPPSKAGHPSSTFLARFVLSKHLPPPPAPSCESNRWTPNQLSRPTLESRCHPRWPSSGLPDTPTSQQRSHQPSWSTWHIWCPLSYITAGTVSISPIITLLAPSTVPGTEQALDKMFTEWMSHEIWKAFKVWNKLSSKIKWHSRERKEKRKKNSWTRHMLKIWNFTCKEREWNGHVLILFSYKEEHKTTRHAKKKKWSFIVWQIKKRKVRTNHREGEKWAMVQYRNRNRWRDKERDRDQERNQQKHLGKVQNRASLLFWEWKGNPPDFERGFRTYLKVKSPCLLKVPSPLHFSKKFLKNWLPMLKIRG